MFRGATVLELGAGTGLTSIITATIAKTVYCTGTIEARTLLLLNLNTANNIYKVTATYRMLSARTVGFVFLSSERKIKIANKEMGVSENHC